MNMPGFTAESAIYSTHNRYDSDMAQVEATDPGAIIPQQSCGWRRWASCGWRIARCITCATSPTCWAQCLGGSWSRCRPCICRRVNLPGVC